MHEEGLALLRELGDKRGMAYALSNLGYIAQEQGDYKAARALHQESLSLLREAGDKWAMAITLGNLGMAAQEEEDYDSARSLHEESLAVALDVDDRQRYERGVASAHTQLSEAEFHKAWQEGRAMGMEEAIECAHEGE